MLLSVIERAPAVGWRWCWVRSLGDNPNSVVAAVFRGRGRETWLVGAGDEEAETETATARGLSGDGRLERSGLLGSFGGQGMLTLVMHSVRKNNNVIPA